MFVFDVFPDQLPKLLSRNLLLLAGVVSLVSLLAFLASRSVPLLLRFAIRQLISPGASEGFQKITEPSKNLISVVTILAAAEAVVVVLPRRNWTGTLEFFLGLSLAITATWLASRLFQQFSDLYLLSVAFKGGRRVNSELLIVGRIVANIVIVVIAIIIFAQTHQINIIGLLASLGVGGIAIAFAAKQVLEQILGSIVIYIDRPFVVDDYIGLSDGTFGRVESIGLRSTKIRTSGKGTLKIIPNNALVDANIENFTGAKKVMSIVYLNFYRAIADEEQALIRQVIAESTHDIFGIDSQSTDVTFREFSGNGAYDFTTQAQITFFILGSGDVSMDLRRQLLDLASQKINQKLREYGIDFDIEEPTIYVDSPITI